MPEPKVCPQCGTKLADGAPQGLCPACLLKQGIASETAPGQDNGKFVPPPPAELAARFPQLEILELLGQGGMGAVYKARQKELDRFVALKILPPNAAKDPGFAERFSREARALARLNHPNIVAVHDFGQVQGSPRREEGAEDDARMADSPSSRRGLQAESLYYLMMEYVDGLNLRQLLRTQKMEAKEALAIVPQICDALQFAHDEGIVHRDIKPENILLDKKGRVKIADFGLAKILGKQPADFSITGKGEKMGTPHYMAPEQVEKPQTVDHRADIYSLGVVFYEMLTGELPLGRFAPPSKKVVIDVRLDEVVLRALEKEPELRYQQASELKTGVETIATTSETERVTYSSVTSHGDAGRFSTGFLPELVPGERVVHFKRRLWAVLNKALPTYRLFVSVPPLWEAGMYVTDRRILFAAHLFGVFSQEFSIWFSRNAEEGRRELFKGVSTGRSLWFGDYLDIHSEAPQRRWYRSRKLRLRLYMRRPELLHAKIVAAQASERVANEPVGATPSAIPPRAPVGMGGSSVGEQPVATPPRFSRAAIVGACWWPFFFIAAFLILWRTKSVAGSSAHGVDVLALLVVLPLALLGLTAPFGTTILGCVALSQIRRSAGKLYGLGLALFDALLFPLLALTGLIGLMWMTFARLLVDFYANPAMQNRTGVNPAVSTKLANLMADHHALPILAAILTALIVDFLIIRWSWRTASKLIGQPSTTGAPTTTAPARPTRSGWGITALILCLAAIVASLLAGLCRVLGLGFHIGVMVFTMSIAFVIAVLCVGIVGWRSTPGKIAVSISALLLLVSVPFGAWVAFRGQRSVPVEQNAQRFSEAQRIAVQARLLVAIRRQLQQRSERFDNLSMSFDSNAGTARYFFSNLQKMKGIGGSNVWVAIDGSLTAHDAGNGNWEVRGSGDLGAVQFTVSVPRSAATQTHLSASTPVIPGQNGTAEVTCPIKFVSQEHKYGIDRFVWRVEPTRPVRLIHGWYAVVDGKPAEHCGGGSNSEPSADPMDLALEVSVQNGKLRLDTQRAQPGADNANLSANVTSEQDIPPPPATDFRRHWQSDKTMLTPGAYVELWRGEFSERRPDGTDVVKKTFIYAARIAGPGEPKDSGFGYPVRLPGIETSALAELPKLRFLEWQDEWEGRDKSPNPGAAWHPDGSKVSDPNEVRLLQFVDPIPCDVWGTGAAAKQPRFLFFWFSHPLFDQQSLNEVSLLDATGKPLPLGADGMLGSRDFEPDPVRANLGWLTHTLSPGNEGSIPVTATVRLRCTFGPWEHERKFAPDESPVVALGNGSQFNGIGQDAQGKTFFAIAVDMKQDTERQFCVVAVTKKGRELSPSGGVNGGGVGEAVRIQQFVFDVPLAEIAHFRLGTRPIRSVEFKEVRLQTQAATAQSLSFGPVIERVVSTEDADEQGLVFFDLETGRALKPPFPLKLQPNQLPAFVDLTPKLKEWIRAKDVDVLLHLGDRSWEMMTLEMQEDFAGQYREWESVTLDKVAAIFAKKDAANLVSGFVPASSGNHGYSDGGSYVKAFRTRSQTMGIYQFEAFENTVRRGVKFRYKLVQEGKQKN